MSESSSVSRIIEGLREDAAENDAACMAHGEHDICGYCETSVLEKEAATALEEATSTLEAIRRAGEGLAQHIRHFPNCSGSRMDGRSCACGATDVVLAWRASLLGEQKEGRDG